MGSSLKSMHVWKLVLLGLLAQMAASEMALSSDGALMCSADASHFSYVHGDPEGPSAWPTISACCGGARQSPRNIITSEPFTVCNSSLPSSLNYQGSTKVTGKLYNKGHDPVEEFSGTTALLQNAPYTNGSYALSNIHIHFHSATGHGSEHAIDFVYYNAEVHMVHYKQAYGSVAEAVMHPDGLVVIGIMLEVTNGTPDHEIVKLIDAIQHVNGVGIAGAVSHEVDLTLLLPSSHDYYTYAGSLTTPPCSETVRWIVMRNTLHIHQHEMDILAGLESSDGGLISDHSNDRPVQTGDTQVETNFGCSLLQSIIG